jgi:hypothetical protein
MTSAHWSRGDSIIEVRPDGKVLVDNDPAFNIDGAGRVFETDGDPIAVLQPDGALVGRNQTAMGQVGLLSAAFPGSSTAWVGMGPKGEVIRYDPEGERSQDGYWQGCGGPAVLTCTLVTHMVLLREWQHRPRVGVGFGIGIGVMH